MHLDSSILTTRPGQGGVAVVAGLAERSEPVPGVEVGCSGDNEFAPGTRVVVGHCGWSVALLAEPLFGEVVAAGLLPLVAVAALGGGSSAPVALAPLFGPAWTVSARVRGPALAAHPPRPGQHGHIPGSSRKSRVCGWRVDYGWTS